MSRANQAFYTSYLELKQSAVDTNINFLQELIGSQTRLSAVVKGNAYGHGIEQFVPMLEKAGIRHFSVFSSAEAQRVLDSVTTQSEIMIMGWIADEHLEWAISNDISFYVFETGRLLEAIHAAKELGKKARIHIEVETGMNRTGFNEHELDELILILKTNSEHISIEGICTHFAGAESISNYIRVKGQIEKYELLYKLLKTKGIKPKMRHTACSAATLSYPETRMDMVRIGIMLYGFWPNNETFIYHLKNNGGIENQTDPLKRVIAWKSQIMSVKKVAAGEFIGYGTSYQAPKNLTIATIPVGYSYGFTRNLSNLGRVLVKGRRVAVIGLVNMNLMIVNVTDIRGVQKGDEVVMIGEQGNKSLTVSSFGELSNQLNYELLSRLPADIPRHVV